MKFRVVHIELIENFSFYFPLLIFPSRQWNAYSPLPSIFILLVLALKILVHKV